MFDYDENERDIEETLEMEYKLKRSPVAEEEEYFCKRGIYERNLNSEEREYARGKSHYNGNRDWWY